MSQFSYIDIFAGCGGLSLGLHNAGWKGLFAIEKSKDAFETLKYNLIDTTQHFGWNEWLPQTEHDGVCRQVVQQKQICCRCHSSYIRNPFSGCHPDEQAVAALHHPKAGMAFHPYRQQGTSGHMGVHKHQGHLPCRLQNQHLLLTEYTSNHSCEVEVYFF